MKVADAHGLPVCPSLVVAGRGAGTPSPPPMHRGKFYLKGSVSLRVPLWLVLRAQEARALGEESQHERQTFDRRPDLRVIAGFHLDPVVRSDWVTLRGQPDQPGCPDLALWSVVTGGVER